MDAASVCRLEALAYRWGGSYDSYLVMDLDREYFWSSGGDAVIGFVLRGSQAVVIGGLIGPEGAREALLKEFIELCRQRRWTACFGLVRERDLPLFDRHGFQSTKIGEDAVIPLGECMWKGGAYEWVRRQSNYCQKQGLVCREVVREVVREVYGAVAAAADAWPARMAELEAISMEFLDRSPHGRTMRYFVGQFDRERLYRRRVFAAIGGGGMGRVEGFVVCTPYRDGAAWGMETYRARADAVRGTLPFVMREAMGRLAMEGAEEASLCLMPAAGCARRRAGDSWFIHMYARVTHRYLNFILDTPGIYHFKTRFRPRVDSVYCSVWPKSSVRPLHAMLDTWGTLRFSVWRVAGRLFRRLHTFRQRRTLVDS